MELGQKEIRGGVMVGAEVDLQEGQLRFRSSCWNSRLRQWLEVAIARADESAR